MDYRFDVFQLCKANGCCGNLVVGLNVDVGLFDETYRGVPLIDR